MKSVGIDIGSASIKVVEVNANSKGIVVSQFVEYPFNMSPNADHEIELIEFLKGITSAYDSDSTRFVVGLRQENISIRLKNFPFNDRQKILKSLPFELEEDLPLTQDTAIFDAKIIRYLGNSAEVLALAAPKHRIETTITRLRDSGFDPHIMTSEGVALANCFEAWNSPIPSLPAKDINFDEPTVDRNITVTVHIGHTRTLICAFEKNSLIGMRTILWGGKNIADSIVRRYEIPFVEAIKEMQTKAFILLNKDGASYDQIVFSDTIASQVKDLAKELRISILEFKAEFNGVVESIGITGGTSQILNLNAYLTQLLELPVNKQKTLLQFSVGNFEKTTRTDSIIGVALGLAIEGLKKPRNPAINFLKGEFAVENERFKRFWGKWKVPIQVGTSIYVTFFIYSLLRDSAANSLAAAAVENLSEKAKVVARLPSKQQNESGVQKYIKEQRKRAEEMKSFDSISKMNSALDILKKINDSVPGKSSMTIDVTKIAIHEDAVSFEGVVANSQQFSSLETTLKSIAVGKIERGTPTMPLIKSGVRFSFNFKVDRGIINRK